MDDPKRHRYGPASPRKAEQGTAARKAFMAFSDGNSSIQFGFAQNAKGQQAFGLKSSGKGHSFELGFVDMGKDKHLMMKMGGQGGKFGLSMNFGSHGKPGSKSNQEFSPMGKSGGPGISMSIKMGSQSGMKMKMSFGSEGNQMSMKFGGGKGKQSGMSMSFGLNSTKGGMGMTMGLGGKTGATGFGGGASGKPALKALTGPGHK